jgi:hypothetical protein
MSTWLGFPAPLTLAHEERATGAPSELPEALTTTLYMLRTLRRWLLIFLCHGIAEAVASCSMCAPLARLGFSVDGLFLGWMAGDLSAVRLVRSTSFTSWSWPYQRYTLGRSRRYRGRNSFADAERDFQGRRGQANKRARSKALMPQKKCNIRARRSSQFSS